MTRFASSKLIPLMQLFSFYLYQKPYLGLFFLARVASENDRLAKLQVSKLYISRRMSSKIPRLRNSKFRNFIFRAGRSEECPAKFELAKYKNVTVLVLGISRGQRQ